MRGLSVLFEDHRTLLSRITPRACQRCHRLGTIVGPRLRDPGRWHADGSIRLAAVLYRAWAGEHDLACAMDQVDAEVAAGSTCWHVRSAEFPRVWSTPIGLGHVPRT